MWVDADAQRASGVQCCSQPFAEGLIALVAGIVGLFVCILIWRGLLELALIVQRIAESIDRATHPGN